jgi:hypothetical protein
MDAAMRNLMLQAGWKLDETWTREVGAKTEDGLTVVYNGRGWQCVLNIYESKSNAKGSELMIRIQPQPAVKQ